MRADAIHWGDISPWEHLVQFYADESAFLDTLEGFICGGLRSGDSAIVIATPAHLRMLEDRMVHGGIDILRAQERDQYIPLDADATLELFMVAGHPDEHRFTAMLERLLARAGQGEWKVRAFGEMVALLMARRQYAATVELEQMWHRACARHGLSLLCGYPAGLAEGRRETDEICRAHSRVLTH